MMASLRRYAWTPLVLILASWSWDARPGAALDGAQAAPAHLWSGVGHLDDGCTATRVHARRVIYPAHCGAAHAMVVFDGRREVRLRGCRVHHDWGYTNGLDVGYCELDEEGLGGVEVVQMADPREMSELLAGTPVTVVGHGNPQPRTKRFLAATLERIRPRLLSVRTQTGGVCRGDSGAPIFAKFRNEPRMIGMISARRRGEACETGVSWASRSDVIRRWLDATIETLRPFKELF
jgi:hypothetical protein